MKTVKIFNCECLVGKSHYPNGRAALMLTVAGTGEDYTVATVNMPMVALGPNEVVIKNYSENEGVLEALETAGIVRPTGRTIQNGFVAMPICELLLPYRELTLDERLEARRGEDRQEIPSRDRGIER